MLASYTKHAHQDVRQQAHRALFRTLRCQVTPLLPCDSEFGTSTLCLT